MAAGSGRCGRTAPRAARSPSSAAPGPPDAGDAAITDMPGPPFVTPRLPLSPWLAVSAGRSAPDAPVRAARNIP